MKKIERRLMAYYTTAVYATFKISAKSPIGIPDFHYFE